MQEHKYHDVSDFPNTTATAGAISIHLLDIVTGATQVQRVGRKIWLTSINVRLMFALSNSATATDIRIRIMVVQDTQCNGALPAVTDILEAAAVDSYLNLVNTGRFRVLKDKVVAIGSTAGTAVAGSEFGGRQVYTKWRKKCLIPVQYNTGGTGDIAEVMSNNIICLGIASTTGGTWGVQCRFRYTD